MEICRVCEADKNLLHLLLDNNSLLVEKLTNFVVFEVSLPKMLVLTNQINQKKTLKFFRKTTSYRNSSVKTVQIF